MQATAHALRAQDVAARLSVSPATGLSEAEALRRAARFGENRLRAQAPASLLSLLGHQLRSVIVWLLSAAALVSALTGEGAEAAAIAVVLLLNGAIGFATELRAARAMEALRHFAEVRTRVRRDGRDRMIDARALVPGDLVVLEGGDMVTADLRLVSASQLQSDESVLTGESLPRSKDAAPVARAAPLGDRTGMLYKGTAVTRGSGTGIVTATGMESELGRISRLIDTAGAGATPLERRLDSLAQTFLWLTLLLAAGSVAAGILRGHDAADMLRTGVALAVAAIPEGLPVVATLALAGGMRRMARHHALIRRLSAVETLGAATLILTDKTGTLTENRMSVVRYLLAGGDADPAETVPPAMAQPLSQALAVGAMCGTADLGPDGSGTGDAMELALLRAARDFGDGAPATAPRIAEHAFDPALRLMATVHPEADGVVFAVKGAPEAVLAACGSVLGPRGAVPLDDAGRAGWLARVGAAAATGLRTLGLALKRGGDPGAPPYEGLTLIGFACLADPLRPGIPQAIAECRAAGVRVVMVTGDHAATALRIARDAGIGEDGIVAVEGQALEALGRTPPDEGLAARLREAAVIARVSPEAKLALVAFHQARGEVVAMTGDGVNDAPALRQADIGVAMGRRGTQVAREAADMVLEDDDLATIVVAIRQGRVIFGNIRKFIVYLMSCNLSEILVVALAVGSGLPMPLLPLQLLFLNLVTDVFPAFALGLGRGDGHEMRRPPRDPGEPFLGRREWLRIALLGAALTAATLFAFLLALFALDLPQGHCVTVAFLTLALAQLWNVFNMRDPATRLLRNDVTANPGIWGALGLCLVLLALAVLLPGLAGILRLPFPGGAGLALALGASLLPLLAAQLVLARGAGRALTRIKAGRGDGRLELKDSHNRGTG
ncbi:cation-translocating P-type ATPase [Oceaniglobus roseus]|uniref:cation-translocating P-type ATPase n=1 Tax=Oceaniglobus roseus TaxID=1737570 RepID=UPI000C7EFF97|nr:cation-translocating P-type ATPase [Kandeliimicrobium roseum]